jgi:hypothetical protein
MRRLFTRAALLTPLLGLGLVCGSELSSGPAVPQPAVKPAPPTPPPPPPDKKTEGTCSTFGTTIEFVDSPSDAAKQAKKEGKLVFVLHVSGNFEDPRFT